MESPPKRLKEDGTERCMFWGPDCLKDLAHFAEFHDLSDLAPDDENDDDGDAGAFSPGKHNFEKPSSQEYSFGTISELDDAAAVTDALEVVQKYVQRHLSKIPTPVLELDYQHNKYVTKYHIRPRRYLGKTKKFPRNEDLRLMKGRWDDGLKFFDATYTWVDFDLLPKNGPAIPLRMAAWEGDGMVEYTGVFAVIRHRYTDQVAYGINPGAGDSETGIAAASWLANSYTPHGDIDPRNEDMQRDALSHWTAYGDLEVEHILPVAFSLIEEVGENDNLFESALEATRVSFRIAALNNPMIGGGKLLPDLWKLVAEYAPAEPPKYGD